MTSDEFQTAGEICESCQERWEEQGLPPKILVALPTYTERYHTQVVVCPYCDGEPILKFSQEKEDDGSKTG